MESQQSGRKGMRISRNGEYQGKKVRFYHFRGNRYYLPIRFATSINTMIATAVILLVFAFVFLINSSNLQKQLAEYESDDSSYQQTIEDDDYANAKQLYDEETLEWKVTLGFAIAIAVGTMIAFFVKLKKVEEDDKNPDGLEEVINVFEDNKVETRKCQYCGAELKDGETECNNCGGKN